MTIRIVCRHCGSKIDAKDELRGQTRNCPKCRQPILIEPEAPQAKPVPKVVPVPSSATDSANVETSLKIRSLRPNNMYVILGHDREIAYWKVGEGWFLNVGNGYSPAKRSQNLIPDFGDFALVEGYVAQTDDGRRLKALRFWELNGRGVLTALGRNEPEILEKAKVPTTLTATHKRFLLQHIRQHYFYGFTDDAPEIVEYLTNVDSHSREIGKFIDE